MVRSGGRAISAQRFNTSRYRHLRLVGVCSVVMAASMAMPAVASASPASASASPASASTAPVGSAPPSVTSIPGITVDSQGTFHYTNAMTSSGDLSGATTTVVMGQRNSAGGCALSGSSLNDGSPSAVDYTVETSFNPGTCEATFVSGHLTSAGAGALAAASPSPAPTGSSSTSTFGSPSSQNNISAPVPAAGSSYNGYWSAFNKVSWVDPVDLTIVSIADNLTWQISGSSIPWASAYYVPYREHIGGDVTTQTEGNLWWSSGSNYTESWSDSSWTNSDFEAWVVAVLGIAGYAACGFNSNPAYFYLQADTAGWNNATFSPGWNSSNSGGCVDLTWLRQNDGPGSGS